MHVHTDQLLGLGHARRHNTSQEFAHADGMRTLRIVKVESVLLFEYGHRFAVCIVLEDQLLEIQERALVGDFLAHLYRCLPHILRCQTRAVRALPVLHHKFHLKNLLQNGGREYLLLDCQLHPQSLAVGLCPYKVGVNESHRLETFEFLEAYGQQLPRLELRNDPSAGGIQIPLAVAAKVDRGLLRDQLCNVDRITKTVYT